MFHGKVSRMAMRVRSAVFVGALVALAPGGALAGPPGTWTRITDTNDANIDQVGTARTPDRVLHVFWQRELAPLNDAIMHTRITPGGAIGVADLVLGGFKATDDPDAALTSDGRLRVFFMGLGNTLAEGGVVAANGSGLGGDWARDGVRVSSTTSATGPAGAAVNAAGQPIFSYAFAFHLGVHTGLDSTVPDTDAQPDALCCDYDPDLATDQATGQTLLAWFSNATGRTGTWVRGVTPSLTAPLLAPGSAKNGQAVGPDQRTAITARPGGGLYMAYCGGYPTCTKALLWRVGAGGVKVAGVANKVEDVHVAEGPAGRLWVSWHNGSALFVRRTNMAATGFGPVVRIKPPSKTSGIWKLTGDGSAGPLDLFASVSRPGSLATWHTQVRPPLTLIVTKGKTKVTFKVVDAGDPVPGAKIVFAGKTLTANSAGKATAPRPKVTRKATATRSGYRPATVFVTP